MGSYIPSFYDWATSPGGVYLHDKKATLATWQPYQIDIFNHIFPGGEARLPYSRILWSDVKKSGKTELAYGVHGWFGLFRDVPGEQYVLANDYEGAKSRVFNAILGGLRQNPLLKEDTDWWITGNQINLSVGTTIKAIASDYRGEAGSNHSLATVDEPWGIVHANALRLMTEFGPVPTRPNSTIFYTGYQGFEGQSDFWHNMIDEAKLEPVPELLHILNGNGEPACWRNGRMFLFWNHQGKQPWHTPEYYSEEKKAYRGRMNEFIRVHENRRVQDEEAFCSVEQWDSLDKTVRAIHTGDTRRIVLGADAAVKSDCTALIGTTWNPENKKVEVLFSMVWTPDGKNPLSLRKTIGAEIVRLHREHRIEACYYDPSQMATISEMCQEAGVKMVEFTQNSNRVTSDTHLHQLLWGGNLAHHNDPVLKKHVTNALSKKQGERGLRIVKELSSMKIDAAVALAMSALGAVEVLAKAPSSQMEQHVNPFYEEE
jgi:phage terminase large subunit-like protein